MRTSVFLIFTLFSANLRAGDPDSVKSYALDPIVITATHAEVLRSTVPSAVSVIDRAQIRESGEHSVLAVVTQRVPGVFVTERGVLGFGAGQGAGGSISIRGAGGSPNTQVLVLTDGRPQMMGLFGHPLPDAYVTSGIERVEVIRGPASVLYGTNAMGGVINIIAPQPFQDGAQLSVGALVGSYGTSRVEAGGNYGNGSYGGSVSFSRSATDGHRPWSSFTVTNGAVRLGLRLNPQYSLAADVGITAFRTYDPGPVFAPLIDNWVDILRGSSGIALENRFASMAGAAKVFFNFGRHKIYDGFFSTDNHFGVMVYESFQLAPVSAVTVGIDYKQYGGEAENTLFNSDFGAHRVNESGGYVLVQHRVARWLSSQAGLRVNRGSTYGTTTVPQVGVAIHALEGTTVKLSASRGFRSPTIRELYLFPAPTPTLKPERMWNYEAGILYDGPGMGSAELTAFVAEGDNIIRVEGAFPNLTLANSGRFVHRGAEIAASLNPAENLAFDLTAHLLDPGNQTMANPSRKVSLGGRYVFQRLSISLGLHYISGLYGGDFKRDRIAPYAVMTGRLTYVALKSLVLSVEAENLLDRSYEVLYGYSMPGRTFQAGVRWTME